uniref:Adipose-secreted signaling protein n=1 Tax=Podarcis muralis TaxID=64176 RepID=A0A670IVR1_PODMU
MATANKGTKSKVGGVRFAPPQPAEGSSSHVHFDEKLHDSVVMVTQEKDGSFLVKERLHPHHSARTLRSSAKAFWRFPHCEKQSYREPGRGPSRYWHPPWRMPSHQMSRK